MEEPYLEHSGFLGEWARSRVVAALGPEKGIKQPPISKERVYSPGWRGTAELLYSSRLSTGRQNSRAWYLSEQDALSGSSLERAIPSFNLSWMK